MRHEGKLARVEPEGVVPRRRAQGGDDQTCTSYYGLPVINQPVWSARDVAGYLFLGGLAGASALVGAGAHVTERPRLARSAKLGAAGAAALSMLALVHDLGRPARALHMLRVVKPTSPMNVGSWLLAAFGPATAVAAASDVTGVSPVLGDAATVCAAVLGPAVAAYTAALISNTAVPSWHEGRREMPFVFVASGASAAAGVGLVLAPAGELAPVRRLAAVAGTTEIVLTKLMARKMGLAGEPYRTGRAGATLRIAEVCTLLGAGGALFARTRRAVALGSGVALLAGSALERFAIFYAGLHSAQDPRYSVLPQRERLSRPPDGTSR